MDNCRVIELLEHYLPEEFRSFIEEKYYARINAQARLEQLVRDRNFLENPLAHAAVFADHGVVHVHDVARQVLQVLDVINGVFIPQRDPDRLHSFMKGYGVLLAYLHDIGMVDFSPFGRAMHPEFATQVVFEPAFDRLLDVLWEQNSGNVAWRLTRLAQKSVLDQEPEIVMRELLSLANCHSKRKVPTRLLNQPADLRLFIQEIVSTPLSILHAQQQVDEARKHLTQAQQERRAKEQTHSLMEQLEQAEQRLHAARTRHVDQPSPQTHLGRYYQDFKRDSYRWLVSNQEAARELVGDVVDTLRALRCADALRQRGTVLKTSGNYEVFVDRTTAHGVYAFRYGTDTLFLMAASEPIAAGEANLASSELTPEGDLRISFHRGRFASQETSQYAAYCAAVVVNDIQQDVLGSFDRETGEGPTVHRKNKEQSQILLEETDDNAEFSNLVLTHLHRLCPSLQEQVRTVPSLQRVSERERLFYLRGEAFEGDLQTRQEILRRLADGGHKTEKMDPQECFQDVKVVHLAAGETLIEAGSEAGFVYIPLEEGVQVYPLGGYQPFSVQPWMPLGNTGVIRGERRNAMVVANRAVTLLMIPGNVYLKKWHDTYSPEELVLRLARVAQQAAEGASKG